MAGVSAKEIKNRIRSMASTRQITKAMEMVASSKLRKAQTRVATSRPYFETLYATVCSIAAAKRERNSPYLSARSGEKMLYVVIAGDRGLASGYNSNIFKLVQSEVEGKNAVVLPIGKKCIDYIRSRQIPILTECYGEASRVSVDECFSIARQLSNSYLSGEFDGIHVVYTRFVSVLFQTPATLQLLPLPQTHHGAIADSGIHYEPNAEEVLAAIVPEYLGGVIYGTLCESRAAEFAARRTAMNAATRNAGEMIDDLKLKYNRARQASITQEITEIISGS